MHNLLDIPDDRLAQTMRLIKAEIAIRGWSASVPYEGSGHCFITRSDGVSLHIFSSTPTTTSFSAAHLANDKMATYELLRTVDTPQMMTALIDGKTNWDDVSDAMEGVSSVVVKPLDGAHGRGVSVGISTASQFDQAKKTALHHSVSDQSKIIVQEQYIASDVYDVRMLVIDGRFIGAIHRVPAYVTGDGLSTVMELIEKENESPERGEPYRARLARIDSEQAERYLGVAADSVPENEQNIFVLGVANYGMGGETHDVTDLIPEWLRQIAERAAMVMDLPVAGVDVLLRSYPSSEGTVESLRPVVIEVNKCPSLGIHDAPTVGASRGATQAYVDYLSAV